MGYCLPLDNSCPFLDIASNITHSALKNNNKQNLFSTDNEIFENGFKTLKNLGISKDDWFVTLHMREPTYRGETYNKNTTNWRNVKVEDYIEGIKAITSRGGYVFRMGNNKSIKLPIIKGLIDYAHSDLNSEYMDIFLGANSKFCIGTSSGFYHIPMYFGKPVLFTNSPMFIEYFGLRDDHIYLPRLTKNLKDNRIFNFSEFTNKIHGIRTHQHHFDDFNIKVVPNTSEEIKEAVIEMIELLDSKNQNIIDESSKQLEFKKIVLSNSKDYYVSECKPKARISNYFINKYEKILY